MTPAQFFYRAQHARKTLPHGDRPTDTHITIARLMSRWQSNTPSHAKLAKAADCSRGTVKNALDRFRELGLLTWKARFIRIGSGLMARASNTYFFHEQSSLPSPKSHKPRDKGIKTGILTRPTKFDHEEKPRFSLAEIAAKRKASNDAAWMTRRV